MTVRLVLKHPSPVRVIPRRGRIERLGFEVISSPVSIPSGDPPALDQAPRQGDPWFPDSGTRIHEGAYWSPLPAAGKAGPVEALHALWERRDVDPAELGRVRAALAFTPLRPGGLKDFGDEYAETDLVLGDPRLDLRGVAFGEVVHEERARSMRALQGWIDANLILAHGRLMLRSPILLQPRAYGAMLVASPRGEVYRQDRIQLTTAGVRGIRPDRALGASDALGLRMDRAAIERTIKEFQAVEKGATGDEDVLLVANRMPAVVMEAASMSCTPGYGRKRVILRAAEAALDAIRPWRLRGALGTIDAGEASDALRACKAALEGLRSAGSGYVADLLGPGGLVPYVERWYADRLDAIPSEDVQALAAFR